MTQDRVIPCNIEAERAVLGSLLLDPDAIDKIAGIIHSRDFFRETHGWIYAAMLRLYEKREPVDQVLLADELRCEERLAEIGGPAYLTELYVSTPSAFYVEHYAKIVQRDAVLRRLIAVGGKIAELAYDAGKMTTEEIIDTAGRYISEMDAPSTEQIVAFVGDLMPEELERIEKTGQTATGIPTGYSLLDRILGGLQKSDLVILAARPGIGKTTLALNIAYNAARLVSARVLIISLEMSKSQLLQKLLSMVSLIDSNKLRSGTVKEDEWPALLAAAQALSPYPIALADPPVANIHVLSYLARRHARQHGLDILVVDYMQLIQGSSNSDTGNRQQEISYISRALKALARELRCVVIAVSQLSRAVESRADKHPMLSDLRECVTGDTLLTNASTGNRVAIKDVHPGDSILALGKGQKIVSATVKDVWQTGIKPVYHLTTRTGRTITASANHPFLTPVGWKQLDELKNGDLIATSLQLPMHGIEKPENADLCRLLGYLAGNGSVQRHRCIAFCGSDAEQVADVVGIVRQKFPGVTWRTKKSTAKYIDGYFASVFANGYGKPGGNPLINWLQEVGLYDCIDSEKSVPDFVFESGSIGAIEFLRGYLATDGCIKHCQNRWSIQFDTTSHSLATDVLYLLSRVGIVATIGPGVFNSKSTKPIYRIELSEHQENLQKFADMMIIPGEKGKYLEQIRQEGYTFKSRSSVLSLPKQVSSLIAQKTTTLPDKTLRWRDQKKATTRSVCLRYAVLLHDAELRAWATSDLLWEPIRSITYVGEEETYDICVETANFLTNGIIAHNSGQIEQDADEVIFLYREDYYDPGTDRPNIVDIDLAKHRHGATGSVSVWYRKEIGVFRDLEIVRTDIEY